MNLRFYILFLFIFLTSFIHSQDLSDYVDFYTGLTLPQNQDIVLRENLSVLQQSDYSGSLMSIKWDGFPSSGLLSGESYVVSLILGYIEGGLSKKDTLRINYYLSGSYRGVDYLKFSSGVGSVKVLEVKSILKKSDDTQVTVSIPSSFSMELHRYYRKPTTIGGVGVLSIDNSKLNTERKVLLSWPVDVQADVYDLEWTYVSDYTETDGIYKDKNQLRYDFRNNSTRVTLPEHYHEMRAMYGHGYVLYRYRGVGLDKVTGERTWEGAWSHIPIVTQEELDVDRGDLSAFPLGGTLKLDNEFSSDKNWSYQRGYGEDGNGQEQLSIGDGNGKPRQVLGTDNETGKTVVKGILYDYAGRSTLDVLGSPLSTSDWGYVSGLYKVGDTIYDAHYFDSKRIPSQARGMDSNTSKGSANYYSSNNSDHTGINGLIPDAGGYPFVETEYDDKGRVVRVSGLGDSLRLGSGRETEYYYQKTNQYELAELFGTEAGNASFYNKVYSKDANGVIRVEYKDGQGRVVASGLVGSSPENLESLKSNEKMERLDLIKTSNYGDVSTQSYQVYEELLVSEGLRGSNQGYRFKYDFSVNDFEYVCSKDLNVQVCSSCLYELRLSIKSSTGKEKYDTTILVQSLQKSKGGDGIGRFKLVSGNGSDTTGYVEFNELGKGGRYIVHKELKLRTDNLEKDFEGVLASSCSKTETEIFEKEFKKRSLDSYPKGSDCMGCQQSYAHYKLQLENLESGYSQQGLDSLKSLCKNICELGTRSIFHSTSATDCDQELDRLARDFMPSGQYALYDQGVDSSRLVSSRTLRSTLLSPQSTLDAHDQDMVVNLGLANKGYASRDPFSPLESYQQYVSTLSSSAKSDPSIRAELSSMGSYLEDIANSYTTPNDVPAYIESLQWSIHSALNASFIGEVGSISNPLSASELNTVTSELAARSRILKRSRGSSDTYSIFNPNTKLKDATGKPFNLVLCLGEFKVQDEDGKTLLVSEAILEKNRMDLVVSQFDISWARKIVKSGFHPEHCYYDYCIENESSNEYESKIVSISNITDAIEQGYLRPLENMPFVTGNVFSVIKKDPLFHQTVDKVTDLSTYQTLLRDTLENYLEKATGGYYTIYEVCSAEARGIDLRLSIEQTSSLGVFGVDACYKELEWAYYRARYLSLRKMFNDMLRTDYAISHGCYNGCIGTGTQPEEVSSEQSTEIYPNGLFKDNTSSCLHTILRFPYCGSFFSHQDSIILRSLNERLAIVDTTISKLKKDLIYYWKQYKSKDFDANEMTISSIGSLWKLNEYNRLYPQGLSYYSARLPILSSDYTAAFNAYIAAENNVKKKCKISWLYTTNKCSSARGEAFQKEEILNGVKGNISTASTAVDKAKGIDFRAQIKYDSLKALASSYRSKWETTSASLKPLEALSKRISDSIKLIKPSNVGYQLYKDQAQLCYESSPGSSTLRLVKYKPNYPGRYYRFQQVGSLSSTQVSSLANQTRREEYLELVKKYKDISAEIIPLQEYPGQDVNISQWQQKRTKFLMDLSASLVEEYDVFNPEGKDGLSDDERYMIEKALYSKTDKLLQNLFNSSGLGVQGDLNNMDLYHYKRNVTDFTSLNGVGCEKILTSRSEYVRLKSMGALPVGVESVDGMLQYLYGESVGERISKMVCDCNGVYAQETGQEWEVGDLFSGTMSTALTLFNEQVPIGLQPTEGVTKSCTELQTAVNLFRQTRNFGSHPLSVTSTTPDSLLFERVENYWTRLTNYLNRSFDFDQPSVYYQQRLESCSFELQTTSGTFLPNVYIERDRKFLNEFIGKELYLVEGVHSIRSLPDYYASSLYPVDGNQSPINYDYASTTTSHTFTFSDPFGLFTSSVTLSLPATKKIGDIFYLDTMVQRWDAFTSSSQYLAIGKDGSRFIVDVTASSHLYFTSSGLSKPYTIQPTLRVSNQKRKQIGLSSLYSSWAESQLFKIRNKASILYSIYKDSLYEDYKERYRSYCYGSVKEHLTVDRLKSEYLMTLYYYDQAGNLVQTVPPSGVRRIQDADSLSRIVAYVEGQTDLYADYKPKHQLESTYRYDAQGRLSSKTSPDGGTTRYLYAKTTGELIASQTAKQEALNRFSYLRYDVYGRPYEVGEARMNTSRVSDVDFMKTQEDNMDASQEIAVSELEGILSHSERSEITLTIYDRSFSNTTVNAQFTELQEPYLDNRVAAVLSYESAYNADLQNYQSGIFFSYDEQGNVKEQVTDNRGVPFEDQAGTYGLKKIDYRYELIGGKVLETGYQRGKNDGFIHRYHYDRNERLQEVKTSNDGELWSSDARYYYYDFGPISRVEYGELSVQGTDYVYTIQGWLKSINSQQLTSNNDPGKDGNVSGLNSNYAPDVLGMNLHYFANDYRSINPQLSNSPIVDASAFLTSSTSQFNGGIAAMSLNVFKKDGSKDPVMYGYRYDQLNRLSSVDAYNHLINNAFQKDAHGYGANQDLSMRIKYDGNGNILNLKRNGITQSAADNRLDSLVYHYQSMSNKLDFVEDLKDTKDSTLGDIRAGQQTGNYQYDASGNLIQDLSEEIQRITWTASGKVWKIERMANSSSSDVEFKYDAFGRRYLKIEKPRGITGFSLPQQWTYTRYENDAQGNLMAVYQTKERSSLTQWEEPGYGDQFIEVQTRLLGNPIYGSTRIGMANTQARIVNIVRVETVSSNTTITVSEVKVDKATYYGNKRYELVGNTGSVHVVISDRKIVTSSGISADILEVNDYYAWGQEIKSRSWTIESDRYLFGYQDMLRENTVNGEGNMYSTEFRMFDARLGRWMSLDPLMDEFAWMSPFVAFDNNPIYFTDPYGLNTIEKDFGEGMGGGSAENNGHDGKGNDKGGDENNNGKTNKANRLKDKIDRLKKRKWEIKGRSYIARVRRKILQNRIDFNNKRFEKERKKAFETDGYEIKPNVNSGKGKPEDTPSSGTGSTENLTKEIVSEAPLLNSLGFRAVVPSGTDRRLRVIQIGVPGPAPGLNPVWPAGNLYSQPPLTNVILNSNGDVMDNNDPSGTRILIPKPSSVNPSDGLFMSGETLMRAVPGVGVVPIGPPATSDTILRYTITLINGRPPKRETSSTRL